MSYCSNCFRDLSEWQSSMNCPCSKGSRMQDALILDKVIALHRPEVDSDDGFESCTGCFGEWPCTTVQVLREWGSHV